VKNLRIYLVITFILAIIVPSNQAMASDELSFVVHPDSMQQWYFHYGKKVTWYIMNIWPSNFLLTKIGPPEMKLGEGVFLTLAAGPDLNVKGKDLFQSFTIDAVPVVSKGSFLFVGVTEAGINKDGKGIYFFRYHATYKGIGARWSGSGIFNEKNEHFQVGPMVSFKPSEKTCFECWFATDIHSGEHMIEFVAKIKL